MRPVFSGPTSRSVVAHLDNEKADEILNDCLDQLDDSRIDDRHADAEWESGRRAKRIVNDQVMMRRALERRSNRRGRVKGVKTFTRDDYDRFNYGGPFVHHFTREATRSSLAGRRNHTLHQFVFERRATVRAATLRVLRRFTNRTTTLPRPPDPRAKCYLSGADDIRPALFQALPC